MRRETGDAKGRRAENAAALFLRLKGYQILARRARTGAGEIDLVARKGDVVAFIEVKFRPDASSAAEAVAPRQQKRIVAAAQAYLARNPRWAEKTLRFDIMLVVPGRWPRHILNAWAASEHNAG